MSRRTLTTVIATIGLLLLATVSLAAWLSQKETADSTFTAASGTPRVDIGNAETTPMFTVTDMSPGDNVVVCFRAEIDLTSTTPATVAKLYSGGVTGTGLDAYIELAIVREDPVPGSTAAPGIIPCTEVTGTLTPLTTGLGERLDAYAASTASYGFGDSLGTLTAKTVNTVDVRVSIWLPADAPALAAGLTTATSWIVEDL